MAQKVKVDIAAEKVSVKRRTDLADVISKQMTTSAFVEAHPEVAAACNTVVTCGKELADADAAVNATRVELVQAESTLARKITAYDGALAVLAAHTEHLAASESDVQSVGLGVSSRASHELAPPLAVEARYDFAKGLIRVNVRLPPGAQGCVTEISTDPSDPTKWQRLKGMGARHALSGYAPGTYWIRAATMKAAEDSEFTGPAAVVVK
jgi:hypothetical protein